MKHTDLTFFTNEPERNLYDRFSKLLKETKAPQALRYTSYLKLIEATTFDDLWK